MTMKMARVLFALLLVVMFTTAPQAQITEEQNKERISSDCFCEYCGHKFPSVRLLMAGTCSKHPDGSNCGPHKLYEGTAKRQYTCRYCGRNFSSIMIMVGGTCARHPKGSNKGNHAPAL